MIRLIAGLGNPGTKYKDTRHNVGFVVADLLRKKLNAISCASKFEADICELHQEGEKVFILKPATFMNKSGLPVGEFARYYKIEPEQTLIVYDDIDLPVGHIRLSQGGSAGGHNGVKSVIENFGQNFWRLRIGIGDNRLSAQAGRAGVPSEVYVLQKFKPEEKEVIKKTAEKAVGIISKLLLGQSEAKIKTEITEYNKSV